MNDPGGLDPPEGTGGRYAVWLHVLFLPYWLFAWYLAAVLTASSGAADAQGVVLALWVVFGIVIFAIGVGFWLTLFRTLLRRRREGRNVSCLLPILWAVCNVFTVLFAVVYFTGAYLIPTLKQRLAASK